MESYEPIDWATFGILTGATLLTGFALACKFELNPGFKTALHIISATTSLTNGVANFRASSDGNAAYGVGSIIAAVGYSVKSFIFGSDDMIRDNWAAAIGSSILALGEALELGAYIKEQDGKGLGIFLVALACVIIFVASIVGSVIIREDIINRTAVEDMWKKYKFMEAYLAISSLLDMILGIVVVSVMADDTSDYLVLLPELPCDVLIIAHSLFCGA